MGLLYWCLNVPRDGEDHYCEFRMEREECIGAMKSEVKVVSLVGQDASRGGSDLPNRVVQVIR